MNHIKLATIDDSKWFAVISPVNKETHIIDNPLIIGFDTEYTSDSGKQKLLTLQFATDKASIVIPSSSTIIGKLLNDSTFLDATNTRWLSVDVFGFLMCKLGYKLEDIPDTIYLVSHFSQAEISNISNLEEISIKQLNKSLVASYQANLPTHLDFETIFKDSTKDTRSITFHIIDLYAYFPTSLEKIGSYINLPKVSLEGIGGKSEEYWKENMDKLLEFYPEDYKRYALRDAEICYHAYTKLRQFFIEKYNLDILKFKTLPAISSYIFRRDYLKDYVTPVRVIEYPRKKSFKSKDKISFSKTRGSQVIYDGDLNVRYYSMLCYHGARVESFYRGRLDDVKLAYYDVDSLYPSSAMLQPLPLKDTKWIKLDSNNDDLIQHAEGFVEVEFRFPDSFMYPCLPVEGSKDGILYFPLSGISFCTLSELRVAIQLGLQDYNIRNGYCFIPADYEINHPLKQYMLDLHELKKSSSKDTIEYNMYKLLMNSLVGKLIQQDDDNITLELVKDKLISTDVYNRITRRIKREKSVGSLWCPEWACLILGKARSIISQFVAKGSYFVSTDSVLLPLGTDISCQALTELRSVGSDLKKEFEVTHGVIIRNRLYALNPLEDNPNQRRIARHSVHMKESEFLERIRYGFITKQIPDLDYTTTKLINYNESLRLNIPLNTQYTYHGKINLVWDNKRLLLYPVDNPFCDSSWTRPLQEVVVSGRRGRKPRVSKDKVLNLYQSGKTQTEIARLLGVNKSTISRIISSINGDKSCQKDI